MSYISNKYIAMKFCTQFVTVYKVLKSLNVTTIGSYHFLQVGLETGASLGNGIPVHIDHGIPDGCLESLLIIVGSAVHFTLQNAPYEIVVRITVWQ